MGHRPDTRRAAVQWLQQRVQPGATVAFDQTLRWFLPDLSRLPLRVLFASDTAPRSWYAQQGVDYAVVGETTPLKDLPAAATIARPPYVYTGNWIRDTYPVIDPKIIILELKSLEVRKTFPSEIAADAMILEPVAAAGTGLFSQVIRLPSHQFDPGSYTIHIAGTWPSSWTPASSSLRLQVLVGTRVVATAVIPGDRPLEVTTAPFVISQTAALPVQVSLDVQLDSQQSVWALRPTEKGCALVLDAPSLNPSQITVEAWILLEGMHPHPGAESEAPILSKNNAAGYYLRLSGNERDVWVDFNVAGKWAVGRGGSIPFKTWTHIAATYDGREARIYVNGQRATQDPNRSSRYDGIMQGQGAPLVIGCRDPGEPYGVVFKGLFTGIRLWNRILSTEEIQEEAAMRRLPDHTPGLIGSWAFHSVVGGVIPDLSPAGNNVSDGDRVQRVPIPEMRPELFAWAERRLNLLRSVTLRRVAP